MKKIKFRGKYKGTGEYVCGDLSVLSSGYYIIENVTWDGSTDVIYEGPLKVYAVEPDSVTQLIGYDRFNKEVYEDDILINSKNELVGATEALNYYDFGDVFKDYGVVEVIYKGK